MRRKLLMVLGLGRVILEDDYVGESYRRELRRLGERVLREVNPID